MKHTNTRNKKSALSTAHTHALILTALMTAVLCVISPFTIPLGPVPLSLCSFALMLAVCLFDTKQACSCVLLYLLIGLVGIPVFSGGGAGFGKLAGPTGGYLIGYVFLALLSGILLDFIPNGRQRRGVIVLALLAGTAALYLFGTLWFMFLTQNSLPAALTLCVLPFLPLDAAKILLCAALCAPIRRRLRFL